MHISFELRNQRYIPTVLVENSKKQYECFIEPQTLLNPARKRTIFKENKSENKQIIWLSFTRLSCAIRRILNGLQFTQVMFLLYYLNTLVLNWTKE